MRKRKEIEKQIKSLSEERRYSDFTRFTQRDNIRVELLLDIRELLILDSPTMQRLSLAKVKIISPEEAVEDLFLDMVKKKARLCDACRVPMKFIKKYKNKSGGKFHTYQCPKCKGKIDFAQIKGIGEFSVHSNIVPKEAKKK